MCMTSFWHFGFDTGFVASVCVCVRACVPLSLQQADNAASITWQRCLLIWRCVPTHAGRTDSSQRSVLISEGRCVNDICLFVRPRGVSMRILIARQHIISCFQAFGSIPLSCYWAPFPPQELSLFRWDFQNCFSLSLPGEKLSWKKVPSRTFQIPLGFLRGRSCELKNLIGGTH